MSEENKNQMDLNKSSDDDLDKAIIQTQNTEEGAEVVEIVETKEEPPKAEAEPYLVELEYPSDKKEETTPPAVTKEPPAKGAEPSPEEVAFKTLKDKIPEMAKFSSFEEYKTAQTKPAEPVKQPDEPPPPEENIELTDEESGVINSKTFEFAQQDAGIMALVRSAIRKSTAKSEEDSEYKPLTDFPKTQGDWDKLLDLDPSLYSQLVTKVNSLKQELTKTAIDYKKQVVTAPKKNEEVVTGFAKKVEGYVEKLHKDYKAEDVKGLIENMEKFMESAVKDGKYYIKQNGVPMLNENLLWADFVTQNAETFGKIQALANRINGGGDVKDTLKKVTQKVSQPSLANQGLSSGNKNVKNLSDPNVRATLSDAELDAMTDFTRKELLTEK